MTGKNQLKLLVRGRSLNNDHAIQSNMIRSKLVGQLDCIASQSRPDIAFEVCSLSSNVKKPIAGDAMKATKILLKALKSVEIKVSSIKKY